MTGAWKEQTLSLLAAANNHSNLAVKLSSLRQVKDVLSSTEPSHAAEVFPYLTELKSSPEGLVRRLLIELIEETGLKTLEHSAALMPVLVSLAKDSNHLVARQSISSGTKFFCAVVEQIALQFHRCGKVERWTENMWHWMLKFKEAVYSILFEPFPVGTKLLALKFVETLVLQFSHDTGDADKSVSRVKEHAFNISWLVGGNPILDPAVLTSEANRSLGTCLDMLRSTSSLPGPLAIAVVNCLATVARKRPVHYVRVFSAFIDLNLKLEGAKGGYIASLRYSLRSAFLGFLRCTHPKIMESKDRLLKTLRAMNASDAADQVLRQVDKMMRNQERTSRDMRVVKDDPALSQHRYSGDLVRKRPLPQDEKELINGSDIPHKRIHYSYDDQSEPTCPSNDNGPDHARVSSKVPLLNSSLNPVEQMIAVIAAMLAEGERGAESLELLISQIHPDLLADIVITNMKHLPNSPLLVSKPGSQHMDLQNSSPTGSAHSKASAGFSTSLQVPASALSTPSTEFTSSMNQPDSKRDPRRDPRRLDPRRVTPIETPNQSVKKEDVLVPLDKPLSPPSVSPVESSSHATSISNSFADGEVGLRPLIASGSETIHMEEKTNLVSQNPPSRDTDMSSQSAAATSVHGDVNKTEAPIESNLLREETVDEDSFKSEDDVNSPTPSSMSIIEETCQELPPVPSYIEFSLEEEQRLRELVVEGIIGSFKQLSGAENCQTRMAILAHLVSQVDPHQQTISLLQKSVTLDYQHQLGHELVMYVLYHLHVRMVSNPSDQSSAAAAATLYERLLLEVAKSLLDTLPASDKSFSRLLGDAPVLMESVLELLENVCCSEGSDQRGKDNREGDRVTQGLGAVWSLILGRPVHRKSCLKIVLKCAVHPHDEVRSKAIRLVANKLYVLGYLSEDIEKYATSMVLSAIDKATESGPSDGELVNDDKSNSGSQQLEPSISVDSSISISEAQRLISLYFALCTKKPSLLHLVFDIYSQASKSVKQGIHRHITTLIRALGSSNSEILHILSNPPKGCEDLLLLVLQILTEQTTPSSDLIAAVKQLYETKLKDASILIPVLSSFSKSEVLPIFPRLVDLPLDKFQTALAHILQGSVCTGPALTPAEVLVAIHDITPEKGGIPLRKVTEACSACFEQRTVFTHLVLAKALNQMVDRTPLPLLFMRTVIQSIDAFPELVDFVMEILSKLVKRQIWKAPKLWVGFLKCVSQTQPHSFPVLLELPAPQLESSLIKYPTLRSSLAAYANQSSVKASLPRSTLAVLGLLNEFQHKQQPRGVPPPPINPSGSSSSVRGVTPI